MNCFVASRQIFSLLLRCANIKTNFIFIPSSIFLFLYYCVFFLTCSPSYWIVEALNFVNGQYLSVFFFKRFPSVHSDELKTQVFRVELSIFLLPKMSLDVWVRRVLCPRRGMEKSWIFRLLRCCRVLPLWSENWVSLLMTVSEDGGPWLSYLALLSAADKQPRSLFSLNWLAPCSWFLLLKVLYNLEVCIKLPFNTHSLAITSHLLLYYKDTCPAPKTSITSYFPHPFTEWMGVSRWFPCNAEPGKSPRRSIQALSLSNFILALILPFVI